MVVYEFPESMENFTASAGYTTIEVRNGRLELDREPEGELLKLIGYLGGVRVKEKTPASEKISSKTKTETKRADNGGGKS